MTNKRLLVVDGLNLFIRQYICDPSISTQGEPVGGLKGVFKSLQKICREVKPTQIVFCWDGPGGSKKKKIIASGYKDGRSPLRLNRNVKALTEQQEIQNRVWQQLRTFEYLNLCPVIQLLFPDIEADDLVSYAVNHKNYADWVKIILSNDKDFIQLCDDKTILMRPTQDEILNKAAIIKEYGIHPKNFALARSIAGDKSDNLAGVGGVGLTSVSSRLPFLSEDKAYTVDEIVEYCNIVDSKLKIYKSIAENKEIVETNYAVMQLYNPSISLQVRGQIDYVFNNTEFEFNKTEFIKQTVTDGVADLNLNDLFALFKRIIDDNKHT